MSTVPFTKESYKEYIKNDLGVDPNDPNGGFYVKEKNFVTSADDPMFDNMCTALTTAITDNVLSNTKDRLDLVESAYDSLLTALTALASAMTALGAVPVVGTVLGTAITKAVTAASVNQPARVTAKSTQDALPTPYIDGHT